MMRMLLVGCAVAVAWYARILPAQEAAQPIPASTDHTSGAADAAAVLDHMIALHLDHVSLRQALKTIASVAGVRIAYGQRGLPLDKLVTIVIDRVSVGEALHAVLVGTNVVPVVAAPGLIALEPNGEVASATRVPMQQGTATISGYARDSATGASIPQVTVRVDGTALEVKSGSDGAYKITGVAAGEYRITARRVGYIAQTRTITLTDGQSVTLNFLLNPPATKLDEVVTTALGDQRRYQVGNDISTINVDSIAPTAPVTSLTDLISARAPGVTVLETSGMTGSGEAIRIEGLTSLVLQNDPILIVDGVRQNNAAGGDVASYFQGSGDVHPSPTRLNDLDFSEIETIDILKGPAASTEYGTDAANGVIVITTKHGQTGAPQWTVSGEQTESDEPQHFPNGYYSWGHATNGTNATENCAFLPLYGGQYAQYGPPYNVGSLLGTCVVDSVTQWNPLDHAATTIFGTGDRQKYDLGVSGGSDAVRYYVAGGLTNETGIIEMPAVFREFADTASLGLPAAAFNPNGEQQRSVRTNTTIKLGSTADLTANASYLATYQQSPNAGYLYSGIYAAPALNEAATAYGYSQQGFASYEGPLSNLSQIGSQNTNRLTGGLTGNWHPVGWLVTHATVGLDHGSEQDQELNYPLANPTYEAPTPYLGLASIATDIYSVDIRGTATVDIVQGVRSATSVGTQMVDTRSAGQAANVNGITTTNLTLNGAINPQVRQLADRQSTLGGYGEEQLSVMDRLFITGALRIDGASGFGAAYNVAMYPKADLSWLLVNARATTVRLRGAFGESGVQPMSGAALQLYSAQSVYLDGGPMNAESLVWPGNANLAPERTAEFEGGMDLDGWGNRLTVALTGYSKTTHDALVDESLGATLDNYTYQENIGEVRNTGAEVSLTATLVESRSVTWSVGMNASINHNTLEALAPGAVAQTVYNVLGVERQAVGYPLYGLWSYPVSYQDANKDGIIEPGELAVGDSVNYVGPSLPTQELSVTTHLAFWRGVVALGALLDYRGGYRIANDNAYEGDVNSNTPGTNIPTASLGLQARAVANMLSSDASALDDEDGSYVRFRELSVTYRLPRSILRALRVQSLSVTGAVRNLALWTRYTGADPEVSETLGDNVQYQPNSGSFQVNNDMRGESGAVPLARYWVVRLNLGI